MPDNKTDAGKAAHRAQPEADLAGARGVLDSAATALVNRLIAFGISGLGPLDSVQEVAAEALQEAGGDREKAIDTIVSSHYKLVAAQGFATGIGGFVTLPVALPANVAGFFTLATRAIGAIAHLRGHDLSDPQVRTAIMLTLMGSDAKGLLGKVQGVTVTGKLADAAADGLPPATLMFLNKGVGFHLLSQAGKQRISRVLGRGVPLVGGVVGAGADTWLLREMLNNARTEFETKVEFYPHEEKPKE
ncbi:MAG: hypothetical protein CSA58_08165 [Micrococcales bacterium]|nr:MAG: hypothetical protein CSB46_10025 [Micrococcales bacterium]PIE26684.1 MAG: hypothetical protein CSA58_08165 [Micrococcales bacterium]